jgi:sigma-B regulation protein RsbU (phosphoserine phosphatase)
MNSIESSVPASVLADKSFLILVVDDDESNRESLRRRLARHGYTVIAAESGTAALEYMERQSFDLVLLDVMMPGMSGLEVLERVRRTRSPTQLPIIMATAKDASEDVVSALENGANDYVTKPLDFAVVLARVKTQLLLKRSVDRVVDLERHLTARNVELERANVKLEGHAALRKLELEAAARIQKTFLPLASPKVEGAEFAWLFEPCQELAGDALNILQLDADHVAFYVLDVSGHGVAASLLAVAATRLLSSIGHGDSIVMRTHGGVSLPVSPAEVAGALNERFTWNPETGQYMTLFYAVLNVKTKELTYVSAGHPGAIQIVRGKEAGTLEGTGQPIGVGEAYEQHVIQLMREDRIYLYSDGVTEAMNPLQELYGEYRLMSLLQSGRHEDLAGSVAALQVELREWHGGGAAKDDISVLGMECR